MKTYPWLETISIYHFITTWVIIAIHPLVSAIVHENI